MNKTFKKVFNARRGKFVAVDETKTGHGQMGTCTVGGGSVKSSLVKAAVVGAMLAMGGTAIAEETMAPKTDVVNGNYTIALDQAAASKDYQINQQDVLSLTVTGAGGTTITGYKKDLNMEYKVCNSTGCYGIDDIPETNKWTKLAIKAAYELAVKAINLTAQEDTEKEANDAAEKLAASILKLDGQDLAKGYWLEVDYKNPEEKAQPVTKDVDGEPVKATNASGNTLLVGGITTLKSEAELVNQGTITSKGLSIDEKSKLNNYGTFLSGSYQKDSEGNVVFDSNNQPVIGSYENVTGSGSIINSGSFVAGSVEAGDITNSGYFQVGDITLRADGEDSAKDNLTANNHLVEAGGSTVVTGNATINNKLDIDAEGSAQVGGAVFVGNVVTGGTFENAGELTIVDGGSLGELADEVISTVLGNIDIAKDIIGDKLSFGYVQIGGALSDGILDNEGTITVQNKDTLSILYKTEVTNDNGSASFGDLLAYDVSIENINGSELNAKDMYVLNSTLSNDSTSNVTTDSMILVGNKNETIIENSGTITVNGTQGIGSLVQSLLPDQWKDANTTEGSLIGSLLNASGLSIGYVQGTGTVENNGTLTVQKDLAEGTVGLSVLVGGKIDNNGTASFKDLLSISGTIENDASGKFTAEDLYLIGGQLTNKATDTKDDEKVEKNFVVDSLIAVGSKNDDGTYKTIIDNDGDMTIKGGANLGDVVTSLISGFGDTTVGGIVTSALNMSTLSAGYVQVSGKLDNSGQFTVDGGISGVFNGAIDNTGKMSFNDMIVYNGTINNTNQFEADNLVVVDGTLTGDIEDKEDAHFTVGTMIVGGTTTNNTTVTVEGQNKLGSLAMNAIGAENLDKLGEVGAFVKGALDATDVKLGYVQVAGNLTNTGSIDANGISGLVAGDINNEGSLKFNEFIAYNGTISNIGQFEADNMVVIGSTLNGTAEDANFTVGSLIATGSNTNETNVTIKGNNKLGTTVLNAIGTDKLKDLGEVGAYVEDALDAANIKLAYAQVGGEFTNKGSIKVEDGVSGLVAGNLKNEADLSFNEFVSYQGTIENAASFNADNMIVVGGELKNAGELTTGALIGAATTITNTSNMIVTGSDAFADAIESYIPKNEDGTETTYGKLATALLDKAHSVGYVQIGGTLDNAATGTLTATGVDKQVASGLVSGEIANKGMMTFDDFVSISGKIANENQFKADDLVLVSGSLTNGTHADVENAPTVTAQSLIAAGTTITNQDGAVIDVTGSEVNHFVVDALDAYLPKDKDGNDTTLSTTVKNVLNAKEVELGLVAVQGTKIENNGTMIVDGVSGLVGSSIMNENSMTFKDQLLAINSDIANTGTLNGQWILGVGSSIVNGEEPVKGTLDADIVGLYQSDLTNNVGSKAEIDSLMALGSTVMNDGTLTTNRGLEMSVEQKADLVKMAAAVGVDISGLDINAEANLGYVGIDSTMTNNGQWDISNAVTLRGSIENAGQINVEGVLMATGTKIHNDKNAVLNTTGGVSVDLGTAENPYVVDAGYVQMGGTMTNDGTWNTDHTVIAGGSVENNNMMKVNGQLVNIGADIVNNAKLQNTAGLHVAGVEVETGYVQLGGTMTNNGTWNVSDIAAAAGSIKNTEKGTLTSGDVTLADTDFTNDGIAKINGHMTMTEVALGDYTNLSNSNEMTVTGLTTLNNIKMENTGTLKTGNGNIDGLLAVKSELTNSNTWDTTNLTMIGGSLNNGKDLTVSGLMTVGGALDVDGKDVTFGADVTNTGTLTTTGKIGVNFGTKDEPRYVDLGYLQVAGSMTNDGKWTTDHTMIIGGSLTNTGLTEDGNGLTVLGQLNNAGGAIINSGDLSTKGGIEVDGKVWNAGYVQTAGSMTNTGTWNASEVYSIGGTLTNGKDAVLNAQSLTLLTTAVANMAGTTTVDSLASVGEGAALNVTGGNLTAEALMGEGTISLTDGAQALSKSMFDVGTLNVSGGSTVMHGFGETFDYANGKGKDRLILNNTLTIKNLNVGVETSMVDADAVAKFGSNSMTVINAQSFVGAEGNFAFKSESGTTLDVDSGATLVLHGVGHGGQYNLAQGFDLNNTFNGWTQADGTLSAPETSGTGLNWILDLEKQVSNDVADSKLYVNATLESMGQSDVYNGKNGYGWKIIDVNIVDEILRTALAADQQASPVSLNTAPVADGDFTRQMYLDLFMDGQNFVEDKILVANSLSSIAQNIAVESLALDNVTDTMKGIEDRASMVGTTMAANGSNLWARAMGGLHKDDGLKIAGGAELGYDATDFGFMIGYDIANDAMNARYGFALSYVNGNVTSEGDLLRTTGDYDTFGIHGYMNWSPAENVNVIATVGYSRSNAEASMNLPTLAGWSGYDKATVDVDTNIFSAGIRAEKSFKVDNATVVPHVGFRVMAIDVRDYDTKVDGETAFHNSTDTAVIAQLPFGVTVKDEFVKNGWTVKPMADVTFVPQFGETKSQTTISLPGSAVSDLYNAEFTGNFAATATFGVDAQKGDYNVGLQLGLTKGDNGKADANFMAKVRYQF